MAKSYLKASRQDEYATAVALAQLLERGYGKHHPELGQLARDLGIVKKTEAAGFTGSGKPIGHIGTRYEAPTPEERLAREKTILKLKRENRAVKAFKGIEGNKGDRLKALKNMKIGKFGAWPLLLLMGMLPMLMGGEE